MGVDVLGQSGVGNQGYYPTDHAPKQNRQSSTRRRTGRSTTTNGDGVANDIPPEADRPQFEDGAFLA